MTDRSEIEALAQRVAGILTAWGELEEAEKRDAIVRDLRELAGRLSAPAVPEGWVLVPRAATRAMVSAGWDSGSLLGDTRIIKSVSDAWAAMLAAAPAPEARQPDGYAYRYPVGRGMTVIRMNGGHEVNGAMPIEAIPYFYGTPAPEAERAKGDAEDTFREFVEMCAEQAGKMVNGNRLSMLAKKVLSSHPAPPAAGQPEGVEALSIDDLAMEWLEKAREVERSTAGRDQAAVNWSVVHATQITLRLCAADLRRLASAQQHDTARLDTARLDYIERTFSGMTNRERYLPVKMIWGKGANGRTLREACDKYMARDAGNSEENDHA